MGNKRDKLKICFIMSDVYQFFNDKVLCGAGGAEVDIYTIAKKLDTLGIYEITIIVNDFGQKDEELYGNIRVMKFKHLSKKCNNTILNKIYRKFVFFHQLMTIDADIFMTEAANELVGWIALVEKIIRRKKFIFRLASDSEADLKMYKSNIKAGSLIKFRTYFLFKFGLYNSTVIISQTEKQKNILKQMNNLDSIIIKNGFFVNGLERYLEKSYLLWVARAVPLKRADLFIELARRLPHKKFIMIAPFNEGTKEQSLEVVKMIKENTKSLKNMEVLDYVPFSDIQRYFDHAELFVNTSEYEGFPNTFIQACLGKTPILSFNVNPDGFIEKNELGYLCNNDIEKAIQFINDLDKEKVDYYGTNALNYVKDNHDIDRICYQYINLFQDAINNLI